MKIKVVITGASGFVGKNLSEYLCRENIDFVNLSLRIENWKINLGLGSNAIIHLAGKAHDTKNTDDVSEYFKINRDLTIKLFEEFLISDINDFIFISSVKATADTVKEILDENTIPDPKTPYGLSKLQAEEYLLSKKLPVGKRLVILRPCMIHGPGNKGNLNLLYKVVSKGIPYPLGSFNNERSYLSIDNLNYIIKSILNNKNIPSGVYNVADDEFISTNKLIAIIAKTLNKNPKIWNISKQFVILVARVGDALKFPLNSERLQKLTENYRVSNQKIKTALGIEKLPYSAEVGLIKTIKYFSK